MAKVRMGFISNSSSSSFIIQKSDLNLIQIAALLNIKTACTMFNLYYYDGEDDHFDKWLIYENIDYIEGSTYMDNFDISELFEKLGIDDSKVHWGD